MKKIFLILFLSIYSIFFSQKNDKTFLNISLDKDMKDYKHLVSSFVEIENEYAIELKELSNNKNHFLTKFKFDNEFVIFTKDGKFSYIMLTKKYLEKDLIEIEYLELRNAVDLSEVSFKSWNDNSSYVVLFAGYIEEIRLIDNFEF